MAWLLKCDAFYNAKLNIYFIVVMFLVVCIHIVNSKSDK